MFDLVERLQPLFDRLVGFLDDRWGRVVAFVLDTVPDWLLWTIDNPEIIPALIVGAAWGALAYRLGPLAASLAVLAMVVLAVLV